MVIIKAHFLLVLLCCSLVSSQDCPTSSSSDNLQVGSKTVTNFGQGAFTANTIVLLSPSIKPQIAASLSSISEYRPDIDGGFQFSVGPKSGNIRRFASINLEISAGNSWKQAKIRYMISGRNDMAIGNVVFPFRQTPTKNSFDVSHKILDQLPGDNYRVAVFLSGLEHSSTNFDFGLYKAHFSNKLLTIKFTTQEFEKLKQIEFMYIVYPTTHPILEMVQNFNPTGEGSYDVAGIIGISQTNVVQEGQWKIINRFLPCQGESCPAKCVKKEECSDLLGQIQNKKCILCQLNDDGKCIPPPPPPPPGCPDRSEINLITGKCECLFGDEYLIDGKCVKCGSNQRFDGKQCACVPNYFRINGECRQCDPRSTYDYEIQDCICNLGFFGDRDLCEQCHVSCSECSGPSANECTKCADISLTLSNGFCSQQGPCPPGSYLNKGTCEQCSEYCTDCNSLDQCNKCSVGFQLQTETYGSETFSFCQEICGDGRRFNSNCDDGNTESGDGCSSICEEQDGYVCNEGTSQTKSICRIIIDNEPVFLQSKGIVNLGTKVLHSIRSEYLPECVTQNQCSDCFKVLDIKVIQSLIPVQIVVNYVPTSKYQFVVEYNFKNTFTASAFTVSFRLQKQFECLSQTDIERVYTLTIDPSTTICAPEETGLLTLEQVNNPSQEYQQLQSKCEKKAEFDVTD